MPSARLSERSRRVLAALVSEYVETGAPVASQTVATRGGFGLSSATVRNVLAALEEQGYVYQPHTSAGRVPTDQGYRCYVDLLLENRRPGRAAQLEAQLMARSARTAFVDETLTSVSHVLSEVTHHVGFVVAAETADAGFQRIDFVPLVDAKVLVIVVMPGGHASNKVIDLGERLTLDDLHQAANYLNEEFAGLPLSEVRAIVLARLAEERTLYDGLMSRALRLARTALEGASGEPVLFIEGAATLFEEAGADVVSLGTLRTLVKMIEEKHRLVRLLTEYMEGPGLTVVIGTEHSAPDLRAFSLVTATYQVSDRRGSIGVLGPTRMKYSRAISVVDSAARAITRLLQHGARSQTP